MPPSLAQLKAISAGIEKDYVRSLTDLVTNTNYVLLLVSYGKRRHAAHVLSL